MFGKKKKEPTPLVIGYSIVLYSQKEYWHIFRTKSKKEAEKKKQEIVNLIKKGKPFDISFERTKIFRDNETGNDSFYTFFPINISCVELIKENRYGD